MKLSNHEHAPLDRDKLSLVAREDALRGAALALDGIQRETPEMQALAVSTLFALTCKRCGLDPELMHHLGVRLMRDEDHHTKANQMRQSTEDFFGLTALQQDVVVA